MKVIGCFVKNIIIKRCKTWLVLKQRIKQMKKSEYLGVYRLQKATTSRLWIVSFKRKWALLKKISKTFQFDKITQINSIIFPVSWIISDSLNVIIIKLRERDRQIDMGLGEAKKQDSFENYEKEFGVWCWHLPLTRSSSRPTEIFEGNYCQKSTNLF